MSKRRVLLTNWTMVGRHGSVMHIRDLALGLLRAGHRPLVYAPELGEVAGELMNATVPVLSDLGHIGEPPDLIHAHSPHDLVTALLAFPHVPAIFTCHAWMAGLAEPPLFTRVRRYIAVDETCRDRLTSLCGLAGARVAVHFNAVDLQRFQPRAALPERPRRALVFSNYATEHGYVGAVRQACTACGLALDVIGDGVGNLCSVPEQVLGTYDVVFAKARAAAEALAVGCAVVLCDTCGFGGLVTSSNVEQLRQWNFGRRALQEPVTDARIAVALSHYDAADAALVSARVRKEFCLEGAVENMLALYQAVIAEHAVAPLTDPSAEMAAVVHFLQWFARPYAEWLRSAREQQALQNRAVSAEREAEVLRQQEAGLVADRAGLIEDTTRLQRVVAMAQVEASQLRHELAASQAELHALRRSATLRIKERLARIPLVGRAFHAAARLVH
jgi:Glycosyltransferase Family 4